MPNDWVKSISFQSDRTRRQILFSYWAVVLLAVPLWWITTSITRLPLPEARVKELEAKQLKFPLHIFLDESIEFASDVVRNGLKNHVHDGHLEGTFSIAVSSDVLQDVDAYEVSENSDMSETYLEGRRLSLGTKLIPAPASTSQLLTDTLSNLLLANFAQDQQAAQYAPRYRLAFTLMNEDAASGGSPLGWDVKAAITREFEPTLQRLSALHNFTIESQVQFFAPLAFEPRRLEDGSFGLTQEQLTIFVNSAEWTLSSSVSNDPVLHFIIFIPSATRRPLRILHDDGSPSESTAFILPQWGSIYIHNPLEFTQTQLTSHALHPAFSLFCDQLLSLLGIPPLPTGVRSSDVLSDWQLDALLRRRAYENANGSKDTLSSIVSLVNQIEGMPVEKDVTDDVREALDALDKMYAVARESSWLALHYSSRALELASRAFFNPGMLALLYFPPEHNLAVYTPLLAPVAVPLVAAVIREVASWRRNRRLP
ncbi:phosphatidylinositol-glycan biosynthesis class S protein-domain-containing protein [Phellopilus nigrolimitatus]|nr:phosphatidylinositol-glycan biosynthesis class S protein-domain-containing protein [Phellopilus nigrolimitatus]